MVPLNRTCFKSKPCGGGEPPPYENMFFIGDELLQNGLKQYETFEKEKAYETNQAQRPGAPGLHPGGGTDEHHHPHRWRGAGGGGPGAVRGVRRPAPQWVWRRVLFHLRRQHDRPVHRFQRVPRDAHGNGQKGDAGGGPLHHLFPHRRNLHRHVSVRPPSGVSQNRLGPVFF